MVDYLYKTVLWKDTSKVTGINVAQNDSDKSDFENNNKSTAKLITSVTLATTTYIHENSYTDFDTLIDGVEITWADVKYTENDLKYELNLISGVEL